MKKILFLLLLLPVWACAQETVKVQDLDPATDPDYNDILYFEEDGVAKNITRALLLDDLSDSVVVNRDSIAAHNNRLLLLEVLSDSSWTSITVDTITEYTADHGVLIEGVTIENGDLYGDADFYLYSGVTQAIQLGGTNALSYLNWNPSADLGSTLGSPYSNWTAVYTPSITTRTFSDASGRALFINPGSSSSTSSAHIGGTLHLGGGAQTALSGGANGGGVFIYGGSSVSGSRGTINFGDGTSFGSLASNDTAANVVGYNPATGLLTFSALAEISGSVVGDSVTTLWAAVFEDTTALSDVAPIFTDTIPLFVFGGGGANAGDTSVFTTSTIYGSFYNGESDTLVITEMNAILQGTTPSVAIDIMWNTTFSSGGATHLNTTPPTVTNTSTFFSDVSFNNEKIPPGVRVWCKTTVVTTRPTYMEVTLLGHKINGN